MTEPRKTPRTDAAWLEHISTVSRDTVGFREHARTLEIETQELAEQKQELVTALGVIARDLRDCGLVCDADNIDKLLARHRAKQEVQS